MTIPKNALVLVADGAKMIFLRNIGDAHLVELKVEGSDAQGSDMGHNRSSGQGHASGEEADPHQQAEDSWAVEVADKLRKRVMNHDFEALAIIAAPKTLGVLRKSLHKEVSRRVVIEIAKEMTDRSPAEIAALLTKEADKA